MRWNTGSASHALFAMMRSNPQSAAGPEGGYSRGVVQERQLLRSMRSWARRRLKSSQWRWQRENDPPVTLVVALEAAAAVAAIKPAGWYHSAA